MKILHVEEQANCTMLTVERDDGELIAHALPVGVLEYRAGQWDLPDDVDPLDFVLVESHLAVTAEQASPYDDDFDAARAKMLKAVRKHRAKIEWGTAETSTATYAMSRVVVKKAGLSRAAVRKRCDLPPGVQDMARDKARSDTVKHREKMRPEPSHPQRIAEKLIHREESAKGFQRNRELRAAEDAVSAMNAVRKQRGAMATGAAPVDSVMSRKGSGAFRVEW